MAERTVAFLVIWDAHCDVTVIITSFTTQLNRKQNPIHQRTKMSIVLSDSNTNVLIIKPCDKSHAKSHAKHYMMTSSRGNAFLITGTLWLESTGIVGITGPLWGESIGRRWTLLTKGQQCRISCFIFCYWTSYNKQQSCHWFSKPLCSCNVTAMVQTPPFRFIRLLFFIMVMMVPVKSCSWLVNRTVFRYT